MRGLQDGQELSLYAPTVAWAGAVCLLLFVLIFVPAVWGDWWRRRKKQGPRCPRCWYSMAGVNGLRCPECGREAPSPRALMKSRRRWFGAALGLFPLAGAVTCGVAVWQGVTDFGARWVPDWVLIDEVYGTGSPRSKEWHGFCTRVMYERYQWRLPATVRAPALKAAGIVAVPARVSVRSVWPSGSSVRVVLEEVAPGTNPVLQGTRAAVTFDQGGLDGVGSGAPAEWDLAGKMLLELGVPKDGSYSLPYALTLRDDSGVVLLTTRSSISFTVGGPSPLKVEQDTWLESWAAAELEKCVRYHVERRDLLVRPIRVADGREDGERELAQLNGHDMPVFPPSFRVRVERDGKEVARGSGPVAVRAAGASDYSAYFTGGSATTLVWNPGEEGRGVQGCELILEADRDAALADPGLTKFVPLVIRLRLERLAQNPAQPFE